MQHVPAVAVAGNFEDVTVWSAWMDEAAPDGLPAIACALSSFQQALVLQVSTVHHTCC